MEQAKKECILRAATRAFARFGFRKASVDDIARAAGVAKGTVYLACDSKEDLFYQSLHREVRALIAEVAQQIDPRVPADELLARVSRSALEALDDRPLVRDLFCGKVTATLPGWTAQLDELRALGRANLIEILRLGIRQGRFRGDLDLEEIAKLIQDLQISTYLFHLRDLGPAERAGDRIGRRFAAALDLVLNGLRQKVAAA
jgi:TetR/AcrR family fatty acid metabolism transcriptional regulator